MPPRVNILGVHVSAINMTQALDLIGDWLKSREQNYVCVTSAHGVLECHTNPALRKIFNNSGMTTPDGMSLVWLLKLKGYRSISRVYGPDLMLRVCEQSVQNKWKHYFYGGAPEVIEELSCRLRERFPGLHVVGTCSPPFRPLSPEEDREIIQNINNCQPDIVWVGISTPKQEQWMAQHLGKLNAPVMIGVGAAFDFLSGRKRQAPRWIQHAGLEWLFRLASEPRRLWRRYSQYPLFAALVFFQAIGLTRYD